MLKRILTIIACLPSSVFAGTYTATLPSTVTVANSCVGLTASALSFGNYDPTSTNPLNSSNTLSVQCSMNSSYTIALNKGTTVGASILQRKMTNGTLILNYNLYTNTQRTQIWGDSTLGTLVNGTGNGSVQNLTVYGQIPAKQVTPQGIYSDTITATVTY